MKVKEMKGSSFAKRKDRMDRNIMKDIEIKNKKNNTRPMYNTTTGRNKNNILKVKIEDEDWKAYFR